MTAPPPMSAFLEVDCGDSACRQGRRKGTGCSCDPGSFLERRRFDQWIATWRAIGDEVFRRAHPCPDCGIGDWLHTRACKVADSCCWFCYLPNDAGVHEPWCRGVQVEP
jgi:hypothetical protein